MTWHPTEVKENGRTRRFVVIVCDNRIAATSPAGVTVTCHTSAEIPARERDNAERIQRILVARGWSWSDVCDGAKDYCPLCTQLREAVAAGA